MTDPTAVDPVLVLIGLLGLVLAGGGAALFRLFRTAPPPPVHDGPTPLEQAAREKEAAAKAAADEAHRKRIAEKVEIDKMPEGPERTKATGDWWERHRGGKRGSVRWPGWLVGLFVVAVLALMLALLAGCLPKEAPPVYSLQVPPLPAEVLAVPAPPSLHVDACDASLVLVPGSPLPPDLYEIGGVATLPRGLTLTAKCRAVPVDENELLFADQADADRARLIAYLTAEREGRLEDHVIAEARAATDWAYIRALRVDNRVKTWTGVGVGLAAFLAGVGLTLAGVQLGATVTP